MQKKILSLQERLENIVDLSYTILCNKVASGGVVIYNEASLQMQLGIILDSIGRMYQFDRKDCIRVELESPIQVPPTCKSKNGLARCDIRITLSQGKSKAEAVIELKHFRKDPNEAVTDNRFSVIQDLENLEHYKSVFPKIKCYEIVYTDNINHTINKGKNTINIGEGATISGGTNYTQGRVVNLANTHVFHWDIYNEHYFMKISF